MTEIKPIQKYYLGTAIKITSLISIATATTAQITIYDASNVKKVTDANMTKEADKVYTYVYQSASTDVEGDYIITIKITYGGYTSVFQDKFTMIEQEPVGAT